MPNYDWEDAVFDLIEQRTRARALVENALLACQNERELEAVFYTFLGHNSTEIGAFLGVTRQRASQLVRAGLMRTLRAGGIVTTPSLRNVFRPEDTMLMSSQKREND